MHDRCAGRPSQGVCAAVGGIPGASLFLFSLMPFQVESQVCLVWGVSASVLLSLLHLLFTGSAHEKL